MDTVPIAARKREEAHDTSLREWTGGESLRFPTTQPRSLTLPGDPLTLLDVYLGSPGLSHRSLEPGTQLLGGRQGLPRPAGARLLQPATAKKKDKKGKEKDQAAA